MHLMYWAVSRANENMPVIMINYGVFHIPVPVVLRLLCNISKLPNKYQVSTH